MKTITTIVKRKPGYPCPHCNGRGDMGDGSSSWSMKVLPNGDHEITSTYQPPTECPVCKGRKRGNFTVIDDSEAIE